MRQSRPTSGWRKTMASARSKSILGPERALQNYFCNKIGQQQTRALQHERITERPRLAAVSPKSDQACCSGGRDSSGVLPVPAPSKQTQRAEAGCKERESGGKWGGRRHRPYCVASNPADRPRIVYSIDA